MKASSFPRICRAWNLETSTMLSPEALIRAGVTISPDGLPAYRDQPFELVLMWYSGKKDHAGRRIFEGDICKVDVDTGFGSSSIDYGIMRWSDDLGQFLLMIPSAQGGHMLNVKKVELLGNEFDNKELVPLVNNEKVIV